MKEFPLAEKTRLKMLVGACVNAASIRLRQGLEPALLADLSTLAAEHGLSDDARLMVYLMAVGEARTAAAEAPERWAATVELLRAELAEGGVI